MDVETSLSTYNKQEESRELMDKTVAENKHALDLANMRYKSGVAALTEVLAAQKVYYASQSQSAMATAGSAQDFVAVYKSLGGGWKNPKKEEPAKPQEQPSAATKPATITKP